MENKKIFSFLLLLFSTLATVPISTAYAAAGDLDNDTVPDDEDDCKLSFGYPPDGCPGSKPPEDSEKVSDSSNADTLEECLNIPPGTNNQNSIQCVKELKNIEGCERSVYIKLLEGNTITYDCNGKINFDDIQIKPAKNSEFKISKDRST